MSEEIEEYDPAVDQIISARNFIKTGLLITSYPGYRLLEFTQMMAEAVGLSHDEFLNRIKSYYETNQEKLDKEFLDYFL